MSYDTEREDDKLKNSIIIHKNEKIPCSVTEKFFTRYDGQTVVNCRITESTAPETDPRFIEVVWEKDLELPPDRPEGQQINITYSYDDNQIMKCSFVDMASGKRIDNDLVMGAGEDLDVDKIDQFIVE